MEQSNRSDDPIDELRRRCLARMNRDLDRNMLLVIGAPRKEVHWLYEQAQFLDIPVIRNDLYTAEPIELMDDLRKRVAVAQFNRSQHFLEEVITVSADMYAGTANRIGDIGRQIANYNPVVKAIPSRRGRHLKPDESRRARYSTSAKK